VLLLVLFLMAMTTPIVCLLLDAHTTHVRCIHNHVEVRTALYVAQAGVHDALSEFLLDPLWRAGFTNKAFPADLGHSYTVTLEDGAFGQIIVTSTGTTSQGYTKTVTATISGI
jgi:hypothetical protein